MIEFKSFDISFGKKRILNGDSLSVPDGQITVILGKNGSGKTTLLRSVFLTRGASLKGEIIIDGKNRADFGSNEFSKSVALMPQNLPAPSISVRELVRLGRSPYSGVFGTLGAKDGEICDSAIESLGISHLAQMPVSALSGGERQKAFFAMILAKGAKNVILDEPASALDLPSAARLALFVKELKKEGKCVLLVMHDLTEALALADRIYVLNGGTASGPMTPEEFVSSNIPETVFSSVPYKVKTENGDIVFFRHT